MGHTTVSIAGAIKEQVQEIIENGGPYRSVSDFVQKWAWIGIMVHTGKSNIDIPVDKIQELQDD